MCTPVTDPKDSSPGRPPLCAPSRFPYLAYFQLFPTSFAHLCKPPLLFTTYKLFFHPQKKQHSCFQQITNSFAKLPGVGVQPSNPTAPMRSGVGQSSDCVLRRVAVFSRCVFSGLRSATGRALRGRSGCSGRCQFRAPARRVAFRARPEWHWPLPGAAARPYRLECSWRQRWTLAQSGQRGELVPRTWEIRWASPAKCRSRGTGPAAAPRYEELRLRSHSLTATDPARNCAGTCHPGLRCAVRPLLGSASADQSRAERRSRDSSRAVCCTWARCLKTDHLVAGDRPGCCSGRRCGRNSGRGRDNRAAGTTAAEADHRGHRKYRKSRERDTRDRIHRDNHSHIPSTASQSRDRTPSPNPSHPNPNLPDPIRRGSHGRHETRGRNHHGIHRESHC
jgi:hypothetical protein